MTRSLATINRASARAGERAALLVHQTRNTSEYGEALCGIVRTETRAKVQNAAINSAIPFRIPGIANAFGDACARTGKSCKTNPLAPSFTEELLALRF